MELLLTEPAIHVLPVLLCLTAGRPQKSRQRRAIRFCLPHHRFRRQRHRSQPHSRPQVRRRLLYRSPITASGVESPAPMVSTSSFSHAVTEVRCRSTSVPAWTMDGKWSR